MAETAATDRDIEILITAEQAWPSFERAVLAARSEIVGGFRIFDLTTRLRSPEGRRIGKDWFDLLAHVARKGVCIDIKVSDFDPVMATDLHMMAWRSVRQGAALADLVGADPRQVRISATLHPARAGLIPRLAFAPDVWRRKFQNLKGLTDDEMSREAVNLHSGLGLPFHPVSHHQKIAVIDQEVLYVGGLDLNERRWDTRDHDRSPEQTWSDVQIMMRDKQAAGEAHKHLKDFEDIVSGTRAPSETSCLRRTMSKPRKMPFLRLSPQTILSEIEETHLEAFARARHLIHVETQYLRSTPIARALAEAGRARPDLGVILVLPALPEEVAFGDHATLDMRYGMHLQRRALARVREGLGDRLVCAAPVGRRLASRESDATLMGSPLIHVHNKLLVVDDDFALVGSGNLNGRSMRWDTETAVTLNGAGEVAKLRRALHDHWWPAIEMRDAWTDPARTAPTWDAEIRRNSVRLPHRRSGFLVTYDDGVTQGRTQNIPGVTEDIV